MHLFFTLESAGIGLLAASSSGVSHPVVLRHTASKSRFWTTDHPSMRWERKKEDTLSFDATWGRIKPRIYYGFSGKTKSGPPFSFVVLWVEKYPEMVKRIAGEGHELGNHSHTHPHMNSLSEREIAHELNRTHHLIKELTGQTPTLFRPPFGEYNNKVIETARACGYTTIIWDVDSLDWKDLTAEAMLDRILQRIKPGSIVLFHNAGKNTPQALARLLPVLKGRGFSIVPISELLHKGETYTDHTGRQFPKPRADQSKPKEGGI